MARDALAALILLVAVALSWCQANDKWNASAWALPTAYGDLERSDVLQHLAFIKAASDGHFTPLRSKIVPELGAPGQANWNDWPIVEEFQIHLAGLLARAIGIFATLNFALLLGHLLAAASFYFVARYCGVAIEWAFAGGMAFGLAPFLFSQSPHHPLVQWCWHVPLLLMVWRWVATEPGVPPGSGRFWFGIGVGLLAGFQMVYYAAIFCQLVLLGALVTFARTRGVGPLLSAIAFIAAAAGAFALMNLDTWAYRWEHGPNPDALVRPFRWLEIYGLSVTNLFVPPPWHHWEFFGNFASRHAAERALADEGSYLGIAGAAALLFLTGATVAAVIRRRIEAWQVLWIILVFMPGGLNAIGGLFGFTFLRTGCRFSVVILAISLLFAVRQLSASGILRRRALSVALALGACGLVFWDQAPRPPTAQEREAIARDVASDRKFAAAMESALPAGAMIFQIPVMDYPESPLANVPACDHFRPWLFSGHLRFSFGTNKGRPDDAWQRALGALPLDQVIAEVKNRGFAALTVNRNGFPDKAAALIPALQSMGCELIAQSEDGELACLRIRQEPVH